jgi:hypothetical protein
MNSVKQNIINEKDLEKYVYLDVEGNKTNSIKNVIIQTKYYIDPKNNDEMTQIVTFVAKKFSDTLLESQKCGEEKFSVDIYLSDLEVKDINYEYIKYLADILKQLFPERLSHARMIDAPRYFITAYDVIKKFMDPPTRKKLKFVKSK